MTFTPFDTKYSPHTDLTMNPVTGVVTITVAFHPNNRGGYNCKVWEFAAPYTGAPMFELEAVLSVPRGTQLTQLRQKLGAACDEINMDWDLRTA